MSEEIRNAVQAECNKIRDAYQALKAIRAGCTHPERRVCNYEIRVGCYPVKVVCADCGELLGDPTEEERAAFKDPFAPTAADLSWKKDSPR